MSFKPTYFKFQEDTVDIILNALEKYPWDNWEIAEDIKKRMDERTGAAWHVVVGEAFRNGVFCAKFLDLHAKFIAKLSY